ncbi:aldos-2-ulose dehydratase [Apiospora arundinis]|uniref:Aldos-2-ulose dehydratase n=1 Tax=Apiospora arundinis TaxID=335852 RepID=A0ABR2I5Y8_9PEZI
MLHVSPPLPFDLPELKFKKVEELWWGGGFKGMDFHNRSGFHFRFLPDNSGCPPPPPSFSCTSSSTPSLPPSSTLTFADHPPSAAAAPPAMAPLAHIQFWTAGKGVNCGVHNHAKDIFCETHVCLSPGTGNGGMARPKPEYAKKDLSEDERNKLGPEAFDFLALKELEEHGGAIPTGDRGGRIGRSIQ